MAVDFDCLALSPCIEAFGVPAVYMPGAGPQVILCGIFNEFTADEKINVQTGEMEQTRVPTLAVRIADLAPNEPLPCRGEVVLVKGRTWQIQTASADGFGQLLITLKRAE